jgi:hypothetical protein
MDSAENGRGGQHFDSGNGCQKPRKQPIENRSPKDMPYAFLVSAVGAITSTAIAMFVIRSWSAMEIAPVVGAIVGFGIGVVTLRLRALPLSASMEEYKAAGKGGSLEEGAKFYGNVALKIAIIISIIEAPILFISTASAPLLFPAGWIVMSVWIFYRVWRLNAENLLGNDLDLFKLIAGIALIALVGVVMYVTYMSLFSPAADDALTLIKFAFIANPFVALGAAVIANLGMGAIGLFAGFVNSQRHQ